VGGAFSCPQRATPTLRPACARLVALVLFRRIWIERDSATGGTFVHCNDSHGTRRRACRRVVAAIIFNTQLGTRCVSWPTAR
jgi:hypothetical protein